MGGSFNPAHTGHLMVARLALKRLSLHWIWWLVTPQNPLKPSRGMASFAERLAGARERATDPRIVVTSLEGDLGLRVTADTVRILRRRFPRARFVWIMGADNLRQMPAWRNWPFILRSLGVAVFDRPTYALGALSGRTAQRFGKFRLPERKSRLLARQRPPAWVFVHTSLNRVSATRIRTGVGTDESWPAKG
ncbi:MAG: nicotinate-nucleotide adenylyltransferase [Rhodospirillaceae bacterium]|nr:nicotinate-nucleotide adenylyltransferase [Rhodospirillaceae bacterium]